MKGPRMLVACMALAMLAIAQEEVTRKVTLAGKVVGSGRDRAKITLYHSDGRGDAVEVVAGGLSQPGGVFELRDMPWFAGSDWRWGWAILVARAENGVGMIQIRGDVDTKALVIELRRTRELRGVLWDEWTGRPLANAWVWPMIFGQLGGEQRSVWPTAPMMPWHTRTDAKGRFVLKGVPVYPQYVLDVGGPHHARRLLQVSKPGQLIEAALVAAGRIEGSVSLANGKPAAGVVVWATGNHEGYARTRTDDQGRYVLESLAEEEYHVEASVLEGWGMAIARTGVLVTAGETREAVDLQFTKCGFVVGRIVDGTTGKPIVPRSAFVWTMGSAHDNCIASSSARIAADGTFRLSAPPGTNRVQLNMLRRGWSSDSKNVTVVVGKSVPLELLVRRSKPRD